MLGDRRGGLLAAAIEVTTRKQIFLTVTASPYFHNCFKFQKLSVVISRHTMRYQEFHLSDSSWAYLVTYM